MLASLHLAIVEPVYVGAILGGRKRVEARLGRDRRAPFGAVRLGDRVCFKRRSGPCVAFADVAQVESVWLSSPEDVDRLRRRVQAFVLAGPGFWVHKREARYATLVWFEHVEPIDARPDLSSHITPGDRSGWHVLPADVEHLIRAADPARACRSA